MKVAFRVDASSTIGTGHVSRCLTLAAELRSRGHEIMFVCRVHAMHLCDLIEARGFDVARLAVRGNEKRKSSYGSWLGASAEDDAADTRAALDAAGFAPLDWLVVDHYAIDAEWEAALSEHSNRIFVIDDLADRPHKCDLLLDHNLVDAHANRYDGLVPRQCSTLLGPTYALLGPDYANYHAIAETRTKGVGRIAVFYGGADQPNLTGRTLDALLAPEFSGITLDIVLGASNVHAEKVRCQALERPLTQVLQSLPSLGALWSSADLALASSGVSTWERICCRLPSLVVTTGDNQLESTRAVERAGCIIDLGPAAQVDVGDIADAVSELIADSDKVRQMSELCGGMVDGLGLSRVAQAMHQS